jgi:hypothetical protein
MTCDSTTQRCDCRHSGIRASKRLPAHIMLELRNQMTETNSRTIGSPIPAAGENRRSQPGWRSTRGVLTLEERLTADYWKIRIQVIPKPRRYKTRIDR